MDIKIYVPEILPAGLTPAEPQKGQTVVPNWLMADEATDNYSCLLWSLMPISGSSDHSECVKMLLTDKYQTVTCT